MGSHCVFSVENVVVDGYVQSRGVLTKGEGDSAVRIDLGVLYNDQMELISTRTFRGTVNDAGEIEEDPTGGFRFILDSEDSPRNICHCFWLEESRYKSTHSHQDAVADVEFILDYDQDDNGTPMEPDLS